MLRREETLGRAIDRKMGAPDRFLAERPPQEAAPLTREEVAAVKELIWGKEVAAVIQNDDEDIMSVPPEPIPPPPNLHERTENVYENKGSEVIDTAASRSWKR